jgi:biotin carboxyl carrier protein
MKRIVRTGQRELILEWTIAGGQVNAAFSENGDSWTAEASVVEVEPAVYSVLCGRRSYEVRVMPRSIQANGRAMEIEVIDPRAAAARRAGFGGEGRCEIAAPMPGKIVRVLVEEGASVEQGQGLVVVEAMKMQNEMKAPKAGKVIALAAKAGASVAAGDVLVTLE